jgi:hypothetical protein
VEHNVTPYDYFPVSALSYQKLVSLGECFTMKGSMKNLPHFTPPKKIKHNNKSNRKKTKRNKEKISLTRNCV